MKGVKYTDSEGKTHYLSREEFYNLIKTFAEIAKINKDKDKEKSENQKLIERKS